MFSTRTIFSSHAVLFDETFSSELAHTPRPYSEALKTHLAVSYIPHDTSSHEETGEIITFAQFNEGGLL